MEQKRELNLTKEIKAEVRDMAKNAKQGTFVVNSMDHANVAKKFLLDKGYSVSVYEDEPNGTYQIDYCSKKNKNYKEIIRNL